MVVHDETTFFSARVLIGLILGPFIGEFAKSHCQPRVINNIYIEHNKTGIPGGFVVFTPPWPLNGANYSLLEYTIYT